MPTLRYAEKNSSWALREDSGNLVPTKRCGKFFLVSAKKVRTVALYALGLQDDW